MTSALLALLPFGFRPAAPDPVERPSATISEAEVTVAVAGQRIALSLAGCRFTAAGASGEYHFTISVLDGDGWTEPGPERELTVTRTPDSALIRVAYPVAGERQLTVELECSRGLPAVIVTSRLERLRSAGSEYYYWASDVVFDRYVGPHGEMLVDAEDWSRLPGDDWLFLPAQHGGLALLPANVSARTPGAGGTLVLHALPTSALVEPGAPLEARFILAAVPDAQAAADLAAQAHDAGLRAPDRPGPTRDWGPAAPSWLQEAEVYNLYYRPAAQWTDEVVGGRLRGFPFIVGSTPDRAALERCHLAGVRLLHYVTYTCLLGTEMQVREGGQVYSEWLESIGNESRDLKDHPDWVCIDSRGEVQHDAWGLAHHHPGLLNTCLHQPGLRDAAVDQVRRLMELGFDGVFVDLAGPTVECHGPRFGKHEHPDDRTNTEAWETLLGEIYRTVKSFGNDRIVMQNTCTGILPSHWASCDSQMLEAFPFGEGSGDLRPTPAELQWYAEQSAEAVKHGKVAVILPYLSGVAPERTRDAALLSLAYARIGSFLWADNFTLLERPEVADLARALYAARLGTPTGPPQRSGDAVFRLFEHGVAAINPTRRPVPVTVPVSGEGPLHDVGYAREVTPVDGALALDLAPEAGRVLVGPPR